MIFLIIGGLDTISIRNRDFLKPFRKSNMLGDFFGNIPMEFFLENIKYPRKGFTCLVRTYVFLDGWCDQLFVSSTHKQ